MTKKVKCFIFFTWFFSVMSIYSFQPDPGFDYFVFSQQWPETLCLKTIQTHRNCTVYQNVSSWTIHGLWPSKMGDKPPMNCKPSAKFNSSALSPIEDKMGEFWPNLFPGTAHYDFWKHEWYKHGTCALKLNATSSEYLYFNMALSLLSKYNLTQILGNASIYPSDTKSYTYQNITSAIKKAWGVNTTVECDTASKTKQYLWQIQICLDTNFTLIDCPPKGGTCDYKNPFVVYPVIKHPYLKHTDAYYDHNMLKQL